MYQELGPVPFDEECVQVGNENYSELAKKECLRYVELLEKRFPQRSEYGCYFGVKSFPHDFGSYYEVVIHFMSNDNQSEQFMLFVDNNLPAKWNDEKVMDGFKPEEKEEEEEW